MGQVFGVIGSFAVTLPSLFLLILYDLLQRFFSIMRGFMVCVRHSFIHLLVLNYKLDGDHRRFVSNIWFGSDIHGDLLAFC
jgi:hypothetical protein